MLPLTLLTTAIGHPMLVELKSGETYNGHLVSCDNFMNIILREDGDRFWRIAECYVRGNTIKYLRIPDEIIDLVQKENQRRQQEASARGGRGGFGPVAGGRGGYQGDRGGYQGDRGRGGSSYRGGGGGGGGGGGNRGGPRGGGGGGGGGRGGGRGGRGGRSGHESD